MKQNFIIAMLAILVVVFGWLAFSPATPNTLSIVGETSAKSPHVAFVLTTFNDITCTYPQTLFANYTSNEITHELPKPETNPIIMTFGEISTATPNVKFIDATRTISEVPLIKVSDDTEKLMFLEGSGEPYLTVHTIYKNSGVSTYAKQQPLLGIPVLTMAMGTCIDS